MLAWEPPVLNQLNGIITHYDGIITETQILYLEDGTIISPRMQSINISSNNTDNRLHILEMLHPSYNYTFTMAAVTNIGKSPYSEPITVTLPMAGIEPLECVNDLRICSYTCSSLPYKIFSYNNYVL